jgi:drug/metabolite transporter (DMT)-like permease
MHIQNKAYINAFIGIIIFSATLPVTKLALGLNNDQLSPEFITLGRSSLAGLLSVLFLILRKKKIPDTKHLIQLAFISLLLIFLFPLLISYGVRDNEAIHSGVILGSLPLFTSLSAAIYFKQKESFLFWIFSFLGFVLIIIFSIINLDKLDINSVINFNYSDLILFLAVITASIGYVVGSKLTTKLGSLDVISWALALSLPITIPFSIIFYPSTSINFDSWISFLYLAVMAQWIGYFFWYNGLSIGGPVKIGQVQLIYPFSSFIFSIFLLNEKLNFFTLVFSVIIVLIIYLTKKFSLK